MNDYHVKSLIYCLKPRTEVSFVNPPALKEEMLSFSLFLENNLLTVEMKDHFSNEAEARKVVDQFLRSWELDVALNCGYNELVFEFIRSEIIDRNPSIPGQPRTINITISTSISSSVSLHLTKNEYPRPPKILSYSPDVATLWNRYQGFLEGREPLLSMDYFCFTLIQWSAQGRKNAAEQYNLDVEILRKLGELTATRGDTTEARKIEYNSSRTPLTENEKQWIIDATKKIIRRKAEYDFNPEAPISLITMSPPVET